MAEWTHTSVRKSTRDITKSISLLARQVFKLHLLDNLWILVIALHVVCLLADIIFILLDTTLVQAVQVASMYVCIEPVQMGIIVTSWASKLLTNWYHYPFFYKLGLNGLVCNTYLPGITAIGRF
jgi:hypothetical protein